MSKEKNIIMISTNCTGKMVLRLFGIIKMAMWK